MGKKGHRNDNTLSWIQASESPATVRRALEDMMKGYEYQSVLSQKDPERLERWLEKAVVATSAAAILDEPN
jgi:hypothetical protein